MESTPKNPLEVQESIPENISENKRKRGRPEKHKKAQYDGLDKFVAKTTRGKQNYINGIRAMALLGNYKEHFAYLLTPKVRITILSEIGRIENMTLMLSTANEICKTRMKTAKAVGLCRRVREKGEPDIFKFEKKISRAIHDYRERYPAVSSGFITVVLRKLLKQCDLHP